MTEREGIVRGRYFEDSFSADRTNTRPKQHSNNDPYSQALELMRQRMTRQFGPDQTLDAGPNVPDEAVRMPAEVFRSYNDQALRDNRPTLAYDPDIFVQKILADILGMGAPEPLLAGGKIEDTAVNGPKGVMVYRHGKWEETGIGFGSACRLLKPLNRGIAGSNRRANIVMPIGDAALPGGERIGVVTHPVATPWPSAVIPIPRARHLTLEDMVRPMAPHEEDGHEPPSNLPDCPSLLDGPLAVSAYLQRFKQAGLDPALHPAR